MEPMRGARRAAGALLLGLAALPAAATAQEGNVANGRRLAEALCARCHVVAGTRAGWTDAPAFETIAHDPKVTRAWLQAFFRQPHLDMLYTDRPPAEAADLSAYLLSLKPR